MSYRGSEGDWICEDPECGNYNFATRLTCNRCKREKSVSKKRKHGHEIGKSAAEKSHGLFSADDWQCEKCGNVNWARRSQCNVCNAPKITTVEERTGVGGGYNERGIVEYKERNESDEDYDEFGRRKKKRRHHGEHNEKSSGDDSSAHKQKDKKSDNGEKSNKNRMERRDRLGESDRWQRKSDSGDDSDYGKRSAGDRGRRSVSSAASSSSANRLERHHGSRTKSKSVDPRHDDYKKVDDSLAKRNESERKHADKVVEEEEDDEDDNDEEEDNDDDDEDDEDGDEDLSKYDLTNC